MYKYRLFLLIVSLVFSIYSCGIIQYCPPENERNLRLALKYTNQIPLTVKELKELIIYDSAHYKLIIFYSPCCGPCSIEMASTYRNAFQNADSTVKFFFIQDDCTGVKYNEAYLKNFGISNQKLYYLRDTSCLFTTKNAMRYTNIVANLFQTGVKINEPNAIPLNFIVSKEGNLKIVRYISGSSDDSTNFHPMRISSLEGFDIRQIRFDIIDDIKLISDSTCSAEKCK